MSCKNYKKTAYYYLFGLISVEFKSSPLLKTWPFILCFKN
jgi:hypothetical protein